MPDLPPEVQTEDGLPDPPSPVTTAATAAAGKPT
jgi:hypothetical protein